MKILFKIYPQRSHYNGTFPIAGALARMGHEVAYVGIESLRAHVEAQGFRYIVQDDDIYPHAEAQPLAGSELISFRDKVAAWMQFRNWAKARWRRCSALDEVIHRIPFDFLMLDSPYSFFALALCRDQKRFGIIESMMPQDQSVGCPPLSSTYIPRGTWWSDRICDGLWVRYLLKRWFLGASGMRPDYDKRLICRTASQMGVSPSDLDIRRYFHIGFRNAPEFVISPQCLDFPRAATPNRVHLSIRVNPDRPESQWDYGFTSRFESMVARRPGIPLVYCSLGTAGWRYKGVTGFLGNVIESAKGSPWNLIVSIGNLDRSMLPSPPPNVAVLQSVPQMRVLKSCDLMITHGGMNSITECVALGVPMLVCPGTHQIDQAGNAARVVYHGIGLLGNLRRETTESLKHKIGQILGNPAFRDQCLRVKQRMDSSPELETIISQYFGDTTEACRAAENAPFAQEGSKLRSSLPKETFDATSGISLLDGSRVEN